jgi:hypothetical protein
MFKNILYLLIIIGFLWQQVGFWSFHGPARCIERKNAFILRAAYKKYLIDGILGLPPNWHTVHHSGDTIDRINKGSDNLFQYAGLSVTKSFVVVCGTSITAQLIDAMHGMYVCM